MSWQEVKIGSGKQTTSAWMRENVIATSPTFKVEDKIVLNGTPCPVLSAELDDREEQILITIVPKGTKNKEKSNDKSAEGGG